MYMYVNFQGIKSGIWSFYFPYIETCIPFIPQKMQETHFYVHMCDAQKRS